MAYLFLSSIGSWFSNNYIRILITTLILVISYVIYYLIAKVIGKKEKKGRINHETAKNLKNIIKISVAILAFTAITLQYQEVLEPFASVWTVAGGTVLGFAAINTIGNLIAGLIVILTKPFAVGDRIKYKGRLADVQEIKLVYTLLEDIDGVKISVPNQKLLKEEIENYGKDMIIRREIFFTAGYDDMPKRVKKVIIGATKSFKPILKFPEPRVDLVDFLDYAVKYRLIVFINNSKIIPKFDHQLRESVFYECRDNGIDLSTPMMVDTKLQSKENTSIPPKTRKYSKKNEGEKTDD